MSRMICLIIGVACMVGAASFFKQSKVMKKFPDTNSVTVDVYWSALGIGLGLTLIKLFLGLFEQFFAGRRMRCCQKVGAYSLSALVFLFTFKVGAKANFFNHLNHSIAGIKADLSQLALNTTTANDIFSKLDWQFTTTENLLFLDIWTLASTLCLCVVCLCIDVGFGNRNAFMDWLFDLLCDLVVHMAADIFGKHWGYGVGFYVAAVVLVACKEYYNEPVQGNQRNPPEVAMADPVQPIQEVAMAGPVQQIQADADAPDRNNLEQL